MTESDPEPACPTPTKTAYFTKRSAIRGALFLSRQVGHGVRTYRCPCGAIHLTTQRRRRGA